MAYFKGQLLERKVLEYSLEELDGKLASIASGTEDTWPTGGFVIPAPPDIIETTRIVIYSMLHNHSLKDRIIVRVRHAASVISVDLKNRPGQRKRAAAMYTDSFVPAAPTGTAVPFSKPLTAPVQQDDMKDIFSESATLRPAISKEEQST
jgi:hypothetical protein